MLVLIVSNVAPIQAEALSIFGKKVKAEEKETIESSSVNHYTSQDYPLPDGNFNPNSPGPKEEVIVIQGDSLYNYTSYWWAETEEIEKSPLSEKIIVYTVKEGDTLSQIAEYFDVSTNTIRWENNISGEKILIGQKLNILPVTGVKHIVDKGDTISKLAQKYEAESEDIFIFNGLSKEDVLSIGDLVFIPNGIIKKVVSSATSGGSKASNTKVDTSYYIRPVAGVITSPYGPRKGGFHYGVDIGNATGTPIKASASGQVIKIVTSCKVGDTNCGGRYGNYVKISHSNGTKTVYAHLSKVSVSVGQAVSQGEVIGALGNTGRSTGPHLHFEIENANGSKMKPPF